MIATTVFSALRTGYDRNADWPPAESFCDGRATNLLWRNSYATRAMRGRKLKR
jgi:hypothetical protein